MPVIRQAAGVAVFLHDGRLLLGLHAHDGRWATIGGAVEPGETPEEAARREVHEEVGLAVTTLEPLGHFANSPMYGVTYPNGDVVSYAVDMFATVIEAGTEPKADRDEIRDVAWAGREHLAALHLAPDMAEIVPAAFAWFDARS